MQKSKVSSIEAFSQECTTDALSMFSRSWNVNVNLLLVNIGSNKSKNEKKGKVDDAKMKKQKSRT